MDDTAELLARSQELYARMGASDPHGHRPPVYKAVGISLAIASGLFIGTSFVLKKVGLLKANVKYNEEAGEGYGYLKNAYWWSGMTLMIIGEICNFVAYAFVDAILVTPLGALSVVVTTILSAIFLKERLSFVGKIGCFQCIVGSVVIVMNAPSQSSAADIQEMKHFVIAPGFLCYAGVVIVGCAFIALWAGPRYGKQSMLVYLTVCSLIGGLSVVATQGLGAAVVTQASGKAQFNQWFLYVLFVFVVATLLTEIVFLNKALNLYNAALVTPTYYVYFTSATIITSAILFQGFKGTVTSIITVVLGFFVICSGVVLLQLSKSAKDVPDAAVFKGDLDQVRTVAEQEESEFEPKADAIRGTAALLGRRSSQSRIKREAAEAKRVHEERLKEQMEPIGEDEIYEWDGLRRRKTTLGSSSGGGTLRRQKTLHPPLGMAHFPDDDPLWDHAESRPASSDVHGGSGLHGRFFSFRRRDSRPPTHTKSLNSRPSTGDQASGAFPARPVTTIAVLPSKTGDAEDTAYHGAQQSDGAMEMDRFGSQHLAPPASPSGHGKPVMWAEDLETRPRGMSGTSTGSPRLAPTPPPHNNKRQFSFQNVFSRHSSKRNTESSNQSVSPNLRPSSANNRTNMSEMSSTGQYSFNLRPYSAKSSKGFATTEEERLGLVKGDSSVSLGPAAMATEDTQARTRLTASPEQTYVDERSLEDSEEWELEPKSLEHGAEIVPLNGREGKGGADKGRDQERDQQRRGGGGADGPPGQGAPPPAFI